MKVRWAILSAALFVVTMGCNTKSLQIVRSPLGAAGPIVAADLSTEQFKFTVYVKNFSNEPTPQAYMNIVVNHPDPDYDSTCGAYKEGTVTIPPLSPGQSWGLNSIPVVNVSSDPDDQPNGNCDCKVNQCAGTIRFRLQKEEIPLPPAPAKFFDGPNTEIEVTWDKSGDLTKVTVKDLSL